MSSPIAHPESAQVADNQQARNLVEEVTLDTLRDKQHKDANGNIISLYPSCS